MVLAKRVKWVFILGAELRCARRQRRIGWVDPRGQRPGLPPMAKKALRRLGQAQVYAGGGYNLIFGESVIGFHDRHEVIIMSIGYRTGLY